MPQKIYFAGELFSLKHLAGNAILAESIYENSNGHYISILPQMLEQRGSSEKAIRNQDLKALLSADVGVFNFDGDEIDSGTVVEYMVAKFIDLPSVVVRTDFRDRSDSESAPWNLMMSFYPRTKVLTFDGMALYQSQIGTYPENDYKSMLSQGVAAASKALSKLSSAITEALDEVSAIPPILKGSQKKEVLKWALKMPGAGFHECWQKAELDRLINSE